MRLLLDTHALYWYVEGDSKLSSTATSLIQVASNEVLISPSSYWEMAIKISLGKWRMNRTYADLMDVIVNQYRFVILPISPSHTERLITLPFHHKDPFDRLLIAQAMAEGISVVSSDSALDAYGVTRIW